MAINRCHRYMDCARLMINTIHYTYVLLLLQKYWLMSKSRQQYYIMNT